MQRTLSRAPLGSIGKSLKEVVVGVEARLQQLQQGVGESDRATGGSSRPSTHSGHSGPSASSKSSAVDGRARGGPTAVGHHRQDDLPPPHPSGASGGSCLRPLTGLQAELSAAANQVSWEMDIPECPLSARDGYGGRPTTRDASRDGDGRGGRSAGIRPCTEGGGGRPATSSGLGVLDGTRPSTRDDMRLQQQLDGTRPSARERKNGSREVVTPRRPSRENRHPSCEGQRPTTRDGVRVPRTDKPQERRVQDVTIRQVTGSRRKRHNQQASEVLNLEAVSTEGSPEAYSDVFSPESSGGDAFGDESVELLE